MVKSGQSSPKCRHALKKKSLTTTLSSIFVFLVRGIRFPFTWVRLHTRPCHVSGGRTLSHPQVLRDVVGQWAGTKPSCGDSPELSVVFVWILTLSLKIVMVGRVSVQLTLA